MVVVVSMDTPSKEENLRIHDDDQDHWAQCVPRKVDRKSFRAASHACENIGLPSCRAFSLLRAVLLQVEQRTWSAGLNALFVCTALLKKSWLEVLPGVQSRGTFKASTFDRPGQTAVSGCKVPP